MNNIGWFIIVLILWYIDHKKIVSAILEKCNMDIIEPVTSWAERNIV